MRRPSRRDFIKTTSVGFAAAGAAMASPLGLMKPARAAGSVTVVNWGGPYMGGTQKALEDWTGAEVLYELHPGAASHMLAKLKAGWPNIPYDAIYMWQPAFVTMMKEGWSAPLPVEDIPNLADVPETLITKDESGNFMSAPLSVNFTMFAARADIVPIEITHIDDLLDPKLKGQICWPNPTGHNNTQLVALALGKGGDAHNTEPGWDMLKEIAKAGNIGRIYSSVSEIINSLSTGETSVAFADVGTLSGVSEHFELSYLTKTDPSIKCFPAVEGWTVLSNSENKKAAFDLVNQVLSPENSTEYNQSLGLVPTSSKATPAAGLDHVVFSDEELQKFAHVPDFDYLSSQVDGWAKRFEAEIVPLL